MSINYKNIEARNQELLAEIRKATQHGDEDGNMRRYHDLIENNQGIIEVIVRNVLQNRGDRDNHYDVLINDARVSVWKCIKNYDPGKKVQFSTYISRSIELDLKGELQDLNMAIKLTKKDKQLMSDMRAFIDKKKSQGHDEGTIHGLLREQFGFEGIQLLQLANTASLDDPKFSGYGASGTTSTDATDASADYGMEREELSKLLTKEEIEILTARFTAPDGQEKPLSFQEIAEEYGVSGSTALQKCLGAVRKVQQKYPDAKLPPTVFQENPDEKAGLTLSDLAYYVALVSRNGIKEMDLIEKGTSSTFYKKIKRLYETIIKSISLDNPTFKNLHESGRGRFFELFGYIFTLLPFDAACGTIRSFFKGKLKLAECGLDELQAYRTLIMWTLEVMADDSYEAEMRLEEKFDIIDSIYYVLYIIKRDSLDVNDIKCLIGE